MLQGRDSAGPRDWLVSGQSRDDLTTAAAELDRLQAQVRALR
jgi:hypothetical protein